MTIANATPLTVNDIKAHSIASGSHWFEPSSMRHFGTRVSKVLYSGPGGYYFVTSDNTYNDGRAYTVRQWLPASCTVETIGDFGGYPDSTTARDVARRHATQNPADALTNAWQDLNAAVYGETDGSTISLDTTAGSVLALIGGYSRFAVRRWSDSSHGFYLDTIETGAHFDAGKWSAAYQLQREFCRILQTIEEGTPETPDRTAETFRPIRNDEQLRRDVEKHAGQPFTLANARKLIRWARSHHRHCVNQCNIADYSLTARDRMENRADKFLRGFGCSAVWSHDPRGCTFKIAFPSGEVNDFGKSGWIVPDDENGTA
jgi:hypothetical protein